MNGNPQQTHKLTRAFGSRRSMLGVTLIELMTVVMVIGILGIVALPSYRQYTMRAHRTEAKSALLQLATNEERYYLQNRVYGDATQLAAAGFPVTSEYGVYAITVATTNGWGRDYTATAAPVAGGGTSGVDQTSDTHCATLSISSAGVRTATNTDCW